MPGRSTTSSRWVMQLFCALLACSMAGGGCRRETAEDEERALAFRAAWSHDTRTLRRLLARNAALANAEEPSRGLGLTQQLFNWFAGFGSRRVLHVSARQGDAEIVRLLLEAGAEVDPPDPLANTPLHLAAQYGHDAAARVLIDAGARVDARRSGGLMPLHVAASHGRFTVAKLLLMHGADVDARDGGGWTPLHYAASQGHENVARLLLGHGASVNARTDGGITPGRLAELDGHHAVIALLQAQRAELPPEPATNSRERSGSAAEIPKASRTP